MSLTILGPWSSHDEIAREGGGKAARLRLLEGLGYTVPPWICIPAEAFDASFARTGLLENGRLRSAAD